MKRILAGVLLASTAFFGVSASALTAEQIVEREVVVTNADGSETVKREKADMVTPGDKVVYSLNYYNDLDKPAENIVLVMPIPGEVTLIEGSAESEGVTTNYSVDGGKTFATRQELMVKTEDNDMRPAKSADITHIRWQVASIDVGERGSLVYKGSLK